VTTESAKVIDAGCPGETTTPITLTAEAKTNLTGHQPSYRWTVNGNPVGEDSPTLSFTVPQQPGQHKVAVTISDQVAAGAAGAPAESVTRDMLTVNVREHQTPTLSGSANPSQINVGDQASLTLTPQGGACYGQLSYSCTAPEGTVSGTPPSAFNSTGVSFDPDRSRAQSKTVNIACTLTDSAGGTASTTIPVLVNLAAQLLSRRVDDIVFAPGSARVNNCGKRILLEEIYPQLTQNPDWELVLVGHRAPNERSAQLDRERVLNVIATLTAGTDTCPNLELSRIRVAFAGTEQTAPPRPGFCGQSTRAAQTERRGQAVSETDANAPLRRVEVYLVPRGAALPDAASNYQAVAASQVSSRGCPK
jgi:hypothetical protein